MNTHIAFDTCLQMETKVDLKRIMEIPIWKDRTK